MFIYLKKIINRLFNRHNIAETSATQHPIDAFLAKSIEEIMLPRSDIIAVANNASFDEVVKNFLKTGFRWLPVYRETLDNITGLVSIQCILSLRESENSEDRWNRHMNQAMFAPTSMTVREALQNFQHSNHVSIIFIVDEYGGIEGMVTKGQILRALCAIWTYDCTEEEMIISRDPIWIINGRMDLETFEEELGALDFFNEEDENRVNTIGGWLCFYLGRVPLKEEIIAHPSGFTFKIRKATPRKIHEITILQMPEPCKKETEQ